MWAFRFRRASCFQSLLLFSHWLSHRHFTWHCFSFSYFLYFNTDFFLLFKWLYQSYIRPQSYLENFQPNLFSYRLLINFNRYFKNYFTYVPHYNQFELKLVNCWIRTINTILLIFLNPPCYLFKPLNDWPLHYST